MPTDTLSVACPYCGAAPGESCTIYGNGEWKTAPHVTRVRAAGKTVNQ